MQYLLNLISGILKLRKILIKSDLQLYFSCLISETTNSSNILLTFPFNVEMLVSMVRDAEIDNTIKSSDWWNQVK